MCRFTKAACFFKDRHGGYWLQPLAAVFISGNNSQIITNKIALPVVNILYVCPFLTLQRYEKYLKHNNISTIFFPF